MLLMEYILRQDSKNIGECHPAFFTNSPRKGAVLENLGGQTGQHLTVFLSLFLVKHTHSQIIFVVMAKYSVKRSKRLYGWTILSTNLSTKVPLWRWVIGSVEAGVQDSVEGPKLLVLFCLDPAYCPIR